MRLRVIDLKANCITLDKTLSKRLLGIVVYNNIMSINEILLAFFLVFIQFCNNLEWIFYNRRLFRACQKWSFSVETFIKVKNHFENFKITSGRGLLLYIMVYQYIMGRALSCSVILNSNFLHYLMLVLVSSSFDFRVCEYVDVEFLFLFGET